MPFDASEIIARILGSPPKAQPPSFVPDQVKRSAAIQQRVHQEFRLVPPPRRHAVIVPQDVPPRQRSPVPCPRCCLPQPSCICPR